MKKFFLLVSLCFATIFSFAQAQPAITETLSVDGWSAFSTVQGDTEYKFLRRLTQITGENNSDKCLALLCVLVEGDEPEFRIIVPQAPSISYLSLEYTDSYTGNPMKTVLTMYDLNNGVSFSTTNAIALTVLMSQPTTDFIIRSDKGGVWKFTTSFSFIDPSELLAGSLSIFNYITY